MEAVPNELSLRKLQGYDLPLQFVEPLALSEIGIGKNTRRLLTRKVGGCQMEKTDNSTAAHRLHTKFAFYRVN